MDTTNVKPSQLNYDKYATAKYDRDIVNSIPYHKQIHKIIAKFISKNYNSTNNYTILDLGVGTGLTSKIVKDVLPNAKFDIVDFSKQMMNGAKRRLGKDNINCIYGDYAKLKFNKNYDIIAVLNNYLTFSS